MGADLDTPIYIEGFRYDLKNTGTHITRYENEEGIDTARIDSDAIVLSGLVEEYEEE